MPPARSSSVQATYSSKRPHIRRKSRIPSHHTQFIDTLNDDQDFHISRADTLATHAGTARRTGWRSPATGQRAPSPHSRANAQPIGASSDVTVDIVSTAGLDKGKGKAHEPRASPSRATRSKTRQKVSQAEAINIVSDDDDDDDDNDVQQVSAHASTSSAPRRSGDTSISSPALQVKEYRRKKEAAMSPADPGSFFSSSSNSTRQRPDGPIVLEEPAERWKPGVHVELSPDPVSQTDHLARDHLGDKPRKLVSRMKPRTTSPNVAASYEYDAPHSSAARVSSSSAGSSRAETNGERSAAIHAVESNATSPPQKRRRTNSAASPSNLRRPEESIPLPLEVPLEAIVVSDFWRSQDAARPNAVFQGRFLCLRLGSENKIRIDYGDIRQVEASSDDVEAYGILCLTLRLGSESAKVMQECFREFDPCASDVAAEIHLIAGSDPTHLEAHKLAVHLIHRKLRGSHSDTTSFRWLTEPNAKSKISFVTLAKPSTWPRQASSRIDTPSLTPAQSRAKRTLIVPGAGRSPDNDPRDATVKDTSISPHASRKKAFDIHPVSPRSAAGGLHDVEMSDASVRERSPDLPSLTVPKSKHGSPAAPIVEARRPQPASSEGDILRYPYHESSIVLLARDFERLFDGELLNDTIIEFGLKLMHDEIRNRDPDLADSIYIFNTFFYKLLSDSSVENSYRRLQRWTSRKSNKVDLFSKKYIVVPICEDFHWYLALIVNPNFMLVDQDQNLSGSSEQSRDEAALSPKAATLLPSAPAADPSHSSAGPERETQQGMAEADSSGPGTPALPASRLPLLSLEARSSSPPIPMDIDTHSRASTPSKGAPLDVSLDQTFVITFDSLGSQHVKVRNRLHEYLWREALDKQKFSPSLLAKLRAKEQARNLAKLEGEKPKTRAQEAVRKDSVELAQDASMDEASDGVKLQDQDQQEAAVEREGARKIQVQDNRQLVAADAAKLTTEEALAKHLRPTTYVHARVPTQPNLCDCGIYLLHYFGCFFGDPDKFLEILVEGKERRSIINKQGSSIRHRFRLEEEKNIESHWQAGAVSGKREWWRQKILELSDGWKAFEKAQQEADRMTKRDQVGEEEEKEAEEEGHSGEGISIQGIRGQQKQSLTEKATRLPKPQVESIVEAAERSKDNGVKERAGVKEGPADADESGPGAQKGFDEVKRRVDGLIRGKDIAGKRAADTALVQALASTDRFSSHEILQQGRWAEQEQKTLSGWYETFRENYEDASTLLEKSLQGPSSPTESSSSRASRRHQQPQQSLRQLGEAHIRRKDEEQDDDEEEDARTIDDERDSSASVTEIVAGSPSASTSHAADSH